MKIEPRRGVIEGFYGRPWTTEQRERMIDLLGEWKLDTFLCSPKDQPSHRVYWQEPYSEAELSKLRNLVERGKKVGVDVGTSLSPGLTLEYSNPDHLQSQLARVIQLSDLGSPLVGIFLDDIPTTLQTVRDRENFADIVEAQIHFVNGLYQKILEAGMELDIIVCPTQYCGIGNEEYISKFGSGLHSDLNLMWTGRQICSTTLTYGDAEILRQSTGHKPFYWDNYPVNDVAMTYELHIGPLRGRESRVIENMSGYLANPMELFESSLIPLRTSANFFKDPEHYDPDSAWQQAVTELLRGATPEEMQAFLHFGRTVQDSCLNGDASPDVSKALNDAAFKWRTGDGIGAAAIFESLAAEISRHAAILCSADFTLSALQKEIMPWVMKYQLGGVVMGEISSVLRANLTMPDEKSINNAINRVQELLNMTHANRYRVFGDHLEMLLRDLIEEFRWAKERLH